jgi:hypothetical protein
MTHKAVVISSKGTIVKARSTATADDSDPVLTSALKSGRVVVKSIPQPPKAEEPKVDAKPETPEQVTEAPTETQVVEEEAEAPVEEQGETTGEEPETQEENKSKRPSRPKVAKEN